MNTHGSLESGSRTNSMDLAELSTLASHDDEYDTLVTALARHHDPVESVIESSVIQIGSVAAVGMALQLHPIVAGLSAAAPVVHKIAEVVRGEQLVRAMYIHIKGEKNKLDYKLDLVKLKVEENQNERKERLENTKMQYADAADQRRAANEKYQGELGGLEQERQGELEEKRIEAATTSKLSSDSIEQAKNGTERLRMICGDRKDARQNELEKMKLEIEMMKLNLQQGHQATL